MNPVRAWNEFWFARVSARPLGFFRIVFGALVLSNLGFLAFDLTYWFTGAGLLQGTEAAQVAGPLRLSLLNTIQDPLSVRLFFAATAAAAVLFILGWHTRIVGVVLYLMMLQIHHRNVMTNSGADTLVLVMMFYMMLSPCGAALSLDALRARRRRGGTAAEPLIVPWAQRLLQLQLCLIYLDTAILKCNGTTWLNGTAIHFVLHNAEVGRSLLTGLAEYPVLINIMTVSALGIELALPFLLWFRATRRWAILAGLGLHAGVLLTVNVPIFGEVMTACYLPFLTSTELDAVFRAANPRSWFARGRRSEPTAASVGRVDAPSRLAGPHLGTPRPIEAPQDMTPSESA